MPTDEAERHVKGGAADPVYIVNENIETVSRSNSAISSLNYSNDPLGISGVYPGATEQALDFVELVVSCYSDVESAENGLVIEASDNGTDWLEVDSYTYEDVLVLKQWKVQLPLEYYRVRYINGAVAQTAFLLVCRLQKTGGVSRSHPLGSDVSAQDDADLVKAVIVARRRGNGGNYENIEADPNGNLYTTIGGITEDAGARVRVSQLTTMGDYKILGYDDTTMWENAGTGTGTFTGNKFNMAVTAGQWYVKSSRRPHHYFSGKSQVFEGTFDTFAPQDGVTKRMGYFSSAVASPYSATLDGFWLESSGGTIALKSSRAGTETLSVDITNWSGYDDLREYQTLSTWDNFTVAFFDFLWLGGAVLRLWLNTSVGFVLAHQFVYSGTDDDVFILTPNQPVRYEIRSTTGSGSFRYVCAQVSTEGSVGESGKSFHADTGTTAIIFAAIGTKYPLLAIRKAAAYRDIVAKIERASMLVASLDTARWTLEINPTLSAPLAYAAITGSALESAVGNGVITVTAAGQIVAGDYLTQNTQVPTDVLHDNFYAYLPTALDGTQGTFVLCVTPCSVNVNAYGAIEMKQY